MSALHVATLNGKGDVANASALARREHAPARRAPERWLSTPAGRPAAGLSPPLRQRRRARAVASDDARSSPSLPPPQQPPFASSSCCPREVARVVARRCFAKTRRTAPRRAQRSCEVELGFETRFNTTSRAVARPSVASFQHHVVSRRPPVRRVDSRLSASLAHLVQRSGLAPFDPDLLPRKPRSALGCALFTCLPPPASAPADRTHERCDGGSRAARERGFG